MTSTEGPQLGENPRGCPAGGPLTGVTKGETQGLQGSSHKRRTPRVVPQEWSSQGGPPSGVPNGDAKGGSHKRRPQREVSQEGPAKRGSTRGPPLDSEGCTLRGSKAGFTRRSARVPQRVSLRRCPPGGVSQSLSPRGCTRSGIPKEVTHRRCPNGGDNKAVYSRRCTTDGVPQEVSTRPCPAGGVRKKVSSTRYFPGGNPNGGHTGGKTTAVHQRFHHMGTPAWVH